MLDSHLECGPPVDELDLERQKDQTDFPTELKSKVLEVTLTYDDLIACSCQSLTSKVIPMSTVRRVNGTGTILK